MMSLKQSWSKALKLWDINVARWIPVIISLSFFALTGNEWNLIIGTIGAVIAALAVTLLLTCYYYFTTPKDSDTVIASAESECEGCQAADVDLKIALDTFEKAVAVWRASPTGNLDAESAGLAQVLTYYRHATEHDYTHHESELSYELEFDFPGLVNVIINQEELAESSFVKSTHLALPGELMRFIYDQFTPINKQFELVVAGNPGTPVDIQRELADSDLDWSAGYNDFELGVADLVAVNTSDAALLTKFAKSDDDRTVYLVAANSDTPARVLDSLSKSLERYEYLALNSRDGGSPEDVVNAYIIVAVAHNPSTSLQTLESILARLPNLSPDDLDEDELDALHEAIRDAVEERRGAS